MEHFYQNIPGPQSSRLISLYTHLVPKLPKKKLHIFEIGCWLGRSSAFLAVELINQEYDFILHCIDTWPTRLPTRYVRFNPNGLAADFVGHIADMDYRYVPIVDLDLDPSIMRFEDMDPATEFRSNMDPVISHIMIHKTESIKAAAFVPDGRADLICLDDDHSYEAVINNVETWWPKLQSGGYLCGDDFSMLKWPGLVRALRERFGQVTVIDLHGNLLNSDRLPAHLYSSAWFIQKTES